MSKVKKDGITMVARDKNQLAAFLNNGWKKVAEEKSADKEISEAELSTRGRKSAQK